MRCAAAILVLAVLLGAARAQDSTQVERGHALVERLCAECHAVGATGDSRHPNAPPFRRLGPTVDFTAFIDRLREGLMVGHPDMPTFRFTRQEAGAIAAYLLSIQTSAPRP